MSQDPRAELATLKPKSRDEQSWVARTRTPDPSEGGAILSHVRDDSGRITRLLRAAADGDAVAHEQVVEWAYGELERLAKARVRRNLRQSTPTLEPSALVNETFLRLLPEDTSFENRRHYLAFAGTIMMRVLVDYQRTRGAKKRGGDAVRVTLSGLGCRGQQSIDMIDFRDVLERLQAFDPRKAEVVRLRLLWGCEMSEIARTVEASITTVERDWRFARTWMAQALAD